MQAPPQVVSHNYQTDIKEKNTGPMAGFGGWLFLYKFTSSLPTSSSSFELSYLSLHSYMQLICSNAVIVLRGPTTYVYKPNP